MDAAYSLLIIEDDEDMSEVMKKILNNWGFNVVLCDNFLDILNLYIQVQPHIVLMDVNIPTYDGFYWCKKIREISNVPIIFISSRDSNMDIVMAINNGGDDYIQKPFDSKVLVAKLQAIIRRTYEYRVYEPHVLEHKNLILNLDSTTICYENKQTELTRNEFKILKTLMENSGKVISRKNLMKQLWNDDIYVNENTLTVNINRLRNKLEDMGINDFIITKKGMGYIIL